MNNDKSCMGMVDVSDKQISKRRAVAQACITLSPKAFKVLLSTGSPKGDVFETAKIAAIMAAKSTPSILPLCHPLPLEKVKVNFETIKSRRTIKVSVEVLCTGKTGVEMEALTAANVACLTIYDMMKWAGQDMNISDIQLIQKSGGKSGVYQR